MRTIHVHVLMVRWINAIISISAAGEFTTFGLTRRIYSMYSARGFLVVLYYDYFLTLPREILFLWPPHNKQGWFTSACLLNRYIPVLGSIPVVVSYFIPVDFEVRPIVLLWSQPHLSLTYNSCKLSYVPTTQYSPNPSCGGLHTYHEWFVMIVQTHAGGTSQMLCSCLHGLYPLFIMKSSA